MAALLVVSIHHSHSQTLAQPPVFEVASITPCKPGTPEPNEEKMGLVQFTAPGGRLNAKATSFKFLLEWAYRILPSQHSEGPSWMENDRYDIIAKADGNPTDAQMRLMTQALLVERFKLKSHRERREAPVLILSPGKTPPKLFPPKPEEPHSIRMEPQTGPDQKLASWHVVATRFSFEQLNDTFSRLLERVIVNRTGLKGDFDFTLDLATDETRPNPLDPSTIITAIRNQLGLAVKSTKAPVDYLVIDNAEKVVAGN